MSLAAIGEVAGILAALATVVTLYLLIRSDARKRAEQDRAEREQIRTDSYAAGVQSQAWLISQLTTQRDDARNARDVARQDARDWESRYNDLRDRRS